MIVLKITLAIIVGFIVGSAVNMGLVTLGPRLIPLPEGINPNDMESFKASAHLLTAKHFVFPFLAHALGTLVGALVAWLIAPQGKQATAAWAIGVMFLAGGIAATFMIPAPKTFLVLDLVLAYLPMAWLATKVGAKIKPS